MKLPVFEDPKSKEPSVSLTILVVSFLGMLAVGGLHVADKISTVSLFPELFYSAVALYFSRRLNIGGKLFTSDKAEEIQTKLGEEK